MATDINVKALAKLGKTLAGLNEAIEIMDGKENSIAKLDGDIAARQKVLADINGDIVKAREQVEAAQDEATKVLADAKATADAMAIKADLDAQEIVGKATKVLDDATEQVKASEKRKADLDLEIAAKSEQVAALTKSEADILARIAEHKAKLLKALE